MFLRLMAALNGGSLTQSRRELLCSSTRNRMARAGRVLVLKPKARRVNQLDSWETRASLNIMQMELGRRSRLSRGPKVLLLALAMRSR
jgi:hypothetical protein